jgi:CRISPR-associated endonuclease Cas1
MASELQTAVNDDLWASRGDYWIKKLHPKNPYTPRTRRRINRPLVLSGHGIKLNIDSQTLVIKCGFTHYPQEKEHYRFFPQDRRLPSRIVILDGDGSITLNAMEWLSEQQVPLVQINWKGEIVSTSATYYSAEPDIVRKQYHHLETKQRFEFAKYLIRQKLLNCISTIEGISDGNAQALSTIKILNERAESIVKTPPTDTPSLLTIEAIAAAAYFRYWFHLPIKWRGLNKRPIPPEWNHIGTRRGKFKSNQYAGHPVNAILNYAYGILEHQVQSHILTLGANPNLGCLHENAKSPQSLVFDLMEPVRPIIDRHVVEFLLSRTFMADDFILDKNGVCKLHPQLARFVVKSVQDIPEISTVTKANLQKLIKGA